MVVVTQIITALLISLFMISQKKLVHTVRDVWIVFAVFIAVYLAVNVLYFLYLFILGALPDKSKKLTSPSRFYQHEFLSADKYLLFHSGARVHVGGKELIDEKQKYIFVSNHRSRFDPMVLAAAFPKNKTAFVSKPENFKIPIAGGVAYKCGYVSLDRSSVRKGLEAIEEAAELVKNNDLSMGIYPEGTRNSGEGLLPFKNGAFKLAQKAGLPIAVVTVKNTEMIAKNFPFKKTDVYLDVLKIIPQEEVLQKRTCELSEEIRLLMEENLAKYKKAEKNASLT